MSKTIPSIIFGFILALAGVGTAQGVGPSPPPSRPLSNNSTFPGH